MPSIIKNANFLNPSSNIEAYPEAIYEREAFNEVKETVEDFFLSSIPGGIHVINGPTGCGKTVMLRYFLFSFLKKNEKFKDRFIYASGNSSKTPKSLLATINHNLGGPVLGKDISSHLKEIQEKLKRENGKRMIIIDEIDKILANSRETPKYSSLMSLYRMNTETSKIILITNHFNFPRSLNAEISSDIYQIILPAYTFEDILEILKKRAKAALNEGSYDLDSLARISRFVCKNPIEGSFANSRNAIQILSVAAHLAQKNGGSLSGILDLAFEKAQLDNYVRLLNKYPEELLYLIKVLVPLHKELAEGLEQFSKPKITHNSLIEEYKKKCEEHSISVTDRTIQNYIGQLTKEGFLRKINQNLYSLEEDPEQVSKALEQLGIK